MKVCLIVNPIAGGGRGASRGEALERALRARGVSALDVFVTRAAGDAALAAGRTDADAIIAVGGDGTLNEVVNGLNDNAPSIGVLPVGTANVVARELGLGKDPEQLAEWVRAGKMRWVDAGLAGGRRFLLGAGAGLDAAVAARVHARRGAVCSYWHWVWPAISTILTYAYPRIRVIVDGEVLCEDAQYAIAGNCVYSAGFFPATRRARIDDGLLDVCAVGRLGPFRIAGLAVRVWGRRFPEKRDVHYRQGRRIIFEPLDSVAAPMQIDGDPAGAIPAAFEVEARALRFFTAP